jgi:hypothetical protein
MVIILRVGERPGATRKAFQVIDVIAMARHHRVIPITHHNEVAVAQRERYIAPFVFGVQALVRAAGWRIR